VPVFRELVLVQRELIHEVIVALLVLARRMLVLELSQRIHDHHHEYDHEYDSM
jgi:hypothetical protein